MDRLKSNALSILFALTAAFALSACEESIPKNSDSALPNATVAIRPALDDAFRQASRFDRIEKLTTALSLLDVHNVDEAVAVYESEEWWLANIEIELFIEAWVRFDPLAALEYAGRWPDRSRRPMALSAVLRSWALHDPQAAKVAFERIAPSYPRQRRLFGENLLVGWVQSGQPGLIEYVAGIPEGRFPINAMWVAGGQTRRLGVPGVLDWLDGHLASVLPEKLKLHLVRRVTGMASRLDPARVATWLGTHEGEAYTSQAPSILTERWIEKDPEAAMDWVAASVPEEERLPMLRNAFTKWVTSNFANASTWVEKAPTGAEYDPAFRAYALVLAQRDGQAAIPWAERIMDEESRRTALTRLASSWYRRDAEAAESWLVLSELDEPSREKVRGSLDREGIRPLQQP